jgi:hypothetical protein
MVVSTPCPVDNWITNYRAIYCLKRWGTIYRDRAWDENELASRQEARGLNLEGPESGNWVGFVRSRVLYQECK